MDFEIKEEIRYITPDKKEHNTKEKAKSHLLNVYTVEQLKIYFRKRLPDDYSEKCVDDFVYVILNNPSPLYNILQGYLHLEDKDEQT